MTKAQANQLIVIALLALTNLPKAQPWSENSGIYNSSGIPSFTFYAPNFADLDNDQDLDLILGGSQSGLTFLENIGTPGAPVFSASGFVQHAINPLDAEIGALADLDDDGDLDLVSGHNLGGIKYYRNDGDALAPLWTANHSQFSSIDLSIYSSVTAGDYDGDSRPDLLMGDVGGGLYLYHNTGNQFQAVDGYFPNLSIGWWLIPRFIDMDNDGDLDVVVANDDGQLHYFRNQGDSQNADWVLSGDYFNGVSGPSNAAPALFDYLNDGVRDLLIGGISGNLKFYHNTGAALQPDWVENTEVFSGIATSQNATPALADLDNDGDADLTICAYDGTFSYFENLAPVTAGDFTPRPAPLAFAIQSVFPNPFNSKTTISFYLPLTDDVQVLVYNLLGRQVGSIPWRRYTTGYNQVKISLAPTLASGLYFIQLRNEEKICTTDALFLK